MIYTLMMQGDVRPVNTLTVPTLNRLVVGRDSQYTSLAEQGSSCLDREEKGLGLADPYPVRLVSPLSRPPPTPFRGWGRYDGLCLCAYWLQGDSTLRR